MTSPDPGNDEVIRFVYQAVADYSALIRETRRAREQTAALKRDIDGLAGDSTARIRVQADTSRARTELRDLIRDAVIKARVVLEAAAARSELARLARDLIIKARVSLDTAAVRTQLAAVSRDLTVRVRVETDGAGLARLAAQLAQIRDLIVKVSVRADTAGLAALRAQLARLRDLIVKVSVQVDDASINELRAKLRRVGGAVLRVAVDFDEAGLEAKFRAILAHLESLGPIKLHVDIDDSVFAKIAALEAAIDALQRRHRTDPPTPPGGGGGGSKSLKDAIPDGLSSAAGMIVKFLPLIAAAVPVAAALAVAVGAVSAALLAAGATAGIFAVAAVGAFAKVTKAVQAYEKSGTLASGPLGRVVDEFEGLKRRYAELEKATQDDVFAVFSHGLSIAVELLDKVQPLVSVAAHAIDAAMGQIDDAVKGPGLDDFLTFVGREGPGAIAGFTRGLLGFGGGLGKLIQQFAPFIHQFVTGFGDAGQAFDRWASSLDSNKGFQDFLAYGRAELPKVIEFVKNLWAAGVNLVRALAPLGDTMLRIANAAAKFIASMPPGELRALVTTVLALAVALKVMTGVLAVTGVISKFSGLIGGLITRMGGAAAGAGGMSLAMGGLATAVTAVMALAISNWLQKTADMENEAADAVDRHRASQEKLNALLAQGKSLSGSDVKKTQLDDLLGMSATGKAGGVLGLGVHQEKVNFADVAKAAGLSDTDLVKGSLGLDPHQQSQNIGKLEAYRRQLLDQADHNEAYGQSGTALRAQADAVEKLETQYGAASHQVGELTGNTKEYNDAIGGATDGTKKSGAAAADAATQYKTQADAAAAVKKALEADFTSDANVTAYTNATAAQDAYTQAVRDHRDAVTDAAKAETAYRDATEAVNDARAAAVQRIKDVQRALRDQAVDERQVALDQKTAQERLDKLIASGGSADEIEQARIDLERAQNAKADFQQDKGPQASALQKELARGVAGNKQLRDAITAQKDARTALSDANTNLANSITNVTDTQLAFESAASKLHLTTGQLEALRKKMDALKGKSVDLVLNTHGAEAKLAALLQGQYAIQLLAAHPDWGLAKALAEAKKQVPSVAAAAKTPAPATPAALPYSPGRGQSQDPTGRAEGGPVPAVASPVTAGAVHGPGTGTSDSVAVRLPVGGPAKLSRGEHIVTDAEVRSAPGGHDYLEAFRAGLRAGRPWGPPGYRGGGPATLPAPRPPALQPVFRIPAPVLPSALPGYAAGGAVAGMRAAGTTTVDRSVTVNVGTINNPVPEPAGTSLYRQVRKAVDGDEGAAR